jgi:hypothetical protein
MSEVSRRGFVIAGTLASLASSIPSAARAAEGAAAPNGEIEARLQWIFAKYGAHLTDEQRSEIRRLVTNGQAGIDAMRAYPLDNGNSPATRFRVWRGSPTSPPANQPVKHKRRRA